MFVIKCGYKSHKATQYKSISKNITRHITDTDDREGLACAIYPKIMEVSLHALPGTFGGNSMLFMVIAC